MAVMRRNRLRMTTEVFINTILPEELIIEILSRIDLTNPLELRCVCKWWKSIVVDPQFVESYLHRSFSDILDLTSTAMEHVESFEPHDIYIPADLPADLPVHADLQDDDDDEEEAMEDDDEEEKEAMKLLVNKVAQLDNLQVIIESMKRNLKTMKVDMLSLKKRMKIFEAFLKIYLKSAPSSSSSG